MNGRRASADGGNVSVHAGGVIRIDDIDVSGLRAGTISITSDDNDVECWSSFDVCRVRARGGSAGAGSVRVTGRNVVFSSIKLQADGGGGDVRMRALNTQLQVVGEVDVRGGGGIFEASAPFTLTAHGTFRAAPGGCIGLASAAIDTAGAVFDTTLVADCPGSPGGAFLD